MTHKAEPTADTRTMRTATCRHCRETIQRVPAAPRWRWEHTEDERSGRPGGALVHPLPPRRGDFVEAERGHFCERPVGIYSCGYPAIYRDPGSRDDEPRFYCQRHAPFAGRDITDREQGAATTPPPVRVVRLAGGSYLETGTVSYTRDEEALEEACEAADLGSLVVELASNEHAACDWYMSGGEPIRILATRAAHFARLALGVS